MRSRFYFPGVYTTSSRAYSRYYQTTKGLAMDYETMTADEANAEVRKLGSELADPGRRRSLSNVMYELGLCYDRLHDLGLEP